MNFPWNSKILKEWSIVGMNHYFVEGIKKPRYLFVAMSKDRQLVKAEGPDEEMVFKDLEWQVERETYSNQMIDWYQCPHCLKLIPIGCLLDIKRCCHCNGTWEDNDDVSSFIIYPEEEFVDMTGTVKKRPKQGG